MHAKGARARHTNRPLQSPQGASSSSPPTTTVPIIPTPNVDGPATAPPSISMVAVLAPQSVVPTVTQSSVVTQPPNSQSPPAQQQQPLQPQQAAAAAPVKVAASSSTPSVATGHKRSCTFQTTGPNFEYMRTFQCLTCKYKPGTVCCAACADLCHKALGHQIRVTSDDGKSQAYCDCGGGEAPGGVKCCCIDLSLPIPSKKVLAPTPSPRLHAKQPTPLQHAVANRAKGLTPEQVARNAERLAIASKTSIAMFHSVMSTQKLSSTMLAGNYSSAAWATPSWGRPLPAARCDYLLHGDESHLMRMYTCRTCNYGPNEIHCEACDRYCHIGHDTVVRENGQPRSGSCDCGPQPQGSGRACQIMIAAAPLFPSTVLLPTEQKLQQKLAHVMAQASAIAANSTPVDKPWPDVNEVALTGIRFDFIGAVLLPSSSSNGALIRYQYRLRLVCIFSFVYYICRIELLDTLV
jgi:hypothetical protein